MLQRFPGNPVKDPIGDSAIFIKAYSKSLRFELEQMEAEEESLAKLNYRLAEETRLLTQLKAKEEDLRGQAENYRKLYIASLKTLDQTALQYDMAGAVRP